MHVIPGQLSLKEKGKWDREGSKANVRWHVTDLVPSFTKSQLVSRKAKRNQYISEQSEEGGRDRHLYAVFSVSCFHWSKFSLWRVKSPHLLVVFPRPRGSPWEARSHAPGSGKKSGSRSAGRCPTPYRYGLVEPGSHLCTGSHQAGDDEAQPSSLRGWLGLSAMPEGRASVDSSPFNKWPRPRAHGPSESGEACKLV